MITTLNDTHLLAWKLFGQQILAKPCVFFPLGCDRGVNLTTTYFCGQNQKGQIEFWKLLVKTLIFNTYYDDEQDKTPDKKRKYWDFGHCLIMLPKGKMFSGTRIISGKCEYPQHKCIACSKRVQTYCLCSPGIYQCAECFGSIWHVPKTIFQHRAEFRRSKTQKNGMPMTTNSSRPKNI